MTDKMNLDGRAFLEQVKTQLQARLEELDSQLARGQQEIAGMHEYYWENYTEMDQYGYEDYDNQQALLGQVRANQETVRLRHRFEKMLDSPFFGRVDFLYEGEEEPENFYIGIGNFARQAGMRPLIYDWRAPVSGLFYDYDRGPASYQAPAGRMEGLISSKWQYQIKRGKLVYAFESDTKIDDEILKQELGNNGDVRLKNIVRTIQREQNAIIRNTRDRILVIQGAAGSGKTSVALHRIAYLLYHDREHLKSSNILILSPNSVFSDYISHILPELGEENIQEMSFDLFAYRQLRDVAGDCEDRYHQLERQMRAPDEAAEARYRRKQSAAFVGELEGFLAELEEELVELAPLEFKGMQLTEEELIRLFYFKFQDIPLLSRMDAVREYFADQYETLCCRELTEEEQEALQAKFDRMYRTRDIYLLYGELLERCGYPGLPRVDWEKRLVEYEDVYPLLYLKYRLTGSAAHKSIKHLVIDEMQDYSYLQYVILEQLFPCKMTILGDRAQTMDGEPQDVSAFLPKIFGKHIRRIVINKSYRNTLEIARYAEGISGITGLEFLERHGKPVTEESFSDPVELAEEIKARVSLGDQGYETAAVLTMTEEEARDIFYELKKAGLPVTYVDRDSTAFPRGLIVTAFYLAKGLEFDQVFALKDEKNPLSRQAQYICATRALHQLYVYEISEG